MRNLFRKFIKKPETGYNLLWHLIDGTGITPKKEINMAILTLLNERERVVISLRFGLQKGEAVTLDEIGKHFGVTRERIRQIEERALLKIKEGFKDVQPLFRSPYHANERLERA